ncbi:DUF6624 domain-containing protein [Streptomyces liliiviolaceus]|uniref:DUF6624 domain-containing protein n=1 Tax=Streptomyces liliiviolaceus TaxID=2823109 RepID=UPI0027E2AE8F|nr:DUF6624 domain-containing protein [Streptomyces liliiviolaceus]
MTPGADVSGLDPTGPAPGGQGRTAATVPASRPPHDERADRLPHGTAETHDGVGETRRGHASDTTDKDRTGLAHDEVREGHPTVLPALATALARELVRRVDEDHRATGEAHRSPTPAARHRLAKCRAGNADALRAIVRRHAWPTADQVGAPASTAALMILLHAPDLAFQVVCRDLIAQAVADGRCPAPHHAYIADHCAVELGQPQFYGTRIDPVTCCPYPVRRPETLDERRRDVGLAPLAEQMRSLRLSG